MATLIQCDRCRAEKKHEDHNLPDGWGTVLMTVAPVLRQPDPEARRELCPDCMKAVKRFVNERPPVYKPA